MSHSDLIISYFAYMFINNVYLTFTPIANDESENIRYQVMHNLCDGSPPHLEDRIVEALEIFNRDKNKKIRRKAHQVLGNVLHNDTWNIM